DIVCAFMVFFVVVMLQAARSTLFPYTTLFRSQEVGVRRREPDVGAALGHGVDDAGVDLGIVQGLTRLLVHEHGQRRAPGALAARSEEHTSELQSRENLVCRLLLDKQKSTY